MNNLAYQQKETSPADALSAIVELPKQIAAQLVPFLEKADIEVYKHFLKTMYHYTKDAEPQLQHARDLCPNEELHEYFDTMAKEERGHYLLAKKDYEEFGEDVTASAEPPQVERFKHYWYGLGKADINEFVGAMYVFENVAAAVGREVVAMMQRLELTKRQSRWLRVHLEADIGHGDEAFGMCKKYVSRNPSAMLEAAQIGAVEWANVFKHAFSHNG